MVLDDPGDIFEFINHDIRKEWENDRRSRGEDPEADEWLLDLHNTEWGLEIVPLDRISLVPRITDYKDSKYNFAESLSRRTENLRKFIEQGSGIIWPLVLRHDGLRLMDGYCRLATLRQLSVTESYCYVGRKSVR